MSAWVGVLAFSMLLWFGLDAYDRVRKANARINADLVELAHEHPRSES